MSRNPSRNYAMNWNINIQRQITPSVMATVGYVGSRSVHQSFTSDEENMVSPTLTSAGWLWPYPVGSGKEFNPAVAEIRMTQWDGDAYYKGLQAEVMKRMSHGIQMQWSYTWSKCTDTGSAGHIADPLFQFAQPDSVLYQIQPGSVHVTST